MYILRCLLIKLVDVRRQSVSRKAFARDRMKKPAAALKIHGPLLLKFSLILNHSFQAWRLTLKLCMPEGVATL